jgi:hypothetical protein
MVQRITKRVISKLRAIRIQARISKPIRVRILTRVILLQTKSGKGDQSIFKDSTLSAKVIKNGVRLITIRLNSSRQISREKRKML